MPWHVDKSDRCPASKPWAVIKDSDGSVTACHTSRGAALAQLAALYAQEGKEMQHLLLKATATTTDEGVFTAVISTATIDREKDVVEAEAMVNALQKWSGVGKRVPLAWNHSGEAADQIGYVLPESARAVEGEVWVEGWIDQETEVGAHAWRQVKSGTLGFSFGYLILKAADLDGGGRHITELDVFEVTATPTPMNNDTRVTGWKSLTPVELAGQIRAISRKVGDGEFDHEVTAVRLHALAEHAQNIEESVRHTEEQLRKASQRLEREQREKQVEGIPEPEPIVLPPKPRAKPEPPPEEEQRVRAQKNEQALQAEELDGIPDPAPEPTADADAIEEAPAPTRAQAQDPLKQVSRAIALEVMSDGASLQQTEEAKAPPVPKPPPEGEQRRRLVELSL